MFMPGSNVVHDLMTILIRFREGYVAPSADIKETSLQVELLKSDRGSLRFFWWTDCNITATPDE